MSHLEILVIAVGLSMDAFAVSLGASATNRARGPRAKFRLAFHFGLFQFLMPILGWLLGVSVARHIQAIDHWIAFGLLGFVGGRMVRAGLAGGGESGAPGGPDPSKGMTLVLLAVATSIDALAVGLSLAMLGSGIWYASLVIGVVTGCLSLVAIGLGTRLGQAFGKRMEIVGGCLLIAIGLRIVVEHL